MKTKLYTIAIAAASLLGFASCSDNWTPGEESTGKGQAKMSGVDVVNSENVISRAGVDVSNFIVKVVNSDGAVVNEWKYAEMPEILTLDVADNYQVDVMSHVEESAAWDAPLFKGSSEKFSIKENDITEIGVVKCKLSNIKVSIKYSEDLRAAMGSDCKVTVIANDEGRLVYTPDETRAGYFKALEGSSTLVATFEGTVNGNYETITRPFKDVEAGQHRIITYSLKAGNPTIPDETGSIDPEGGITVDSSTVDESVEGNVNPGDEEIIDGDRPGQEDPENPENPDNPEKPDEPVPGNNFDITASWIAGGVDLSSVVSTPEENGTYEVTIKSANPLSNLIVKIESESLNDEMLQGVGLAAEFDLANPIVNIDGENVDLTDALSGSFGFPVRGQVTGQKEVLFNITPFVPLLNIYPGELHVFRLTIKDQSGNTTEVALKFQS